MFAKKRQLKNSRRGAALVELAGFSAGVVFDYDGNSRNMSRYLLTTINKIAAFESARLSNLPDAYVRDGPDSNRLRPFRRNIRNMRLLARQILPRQQRKGI